MRRALCSLFALVVVVGLVSVGGSTQASSGKLGRRVTPRWVKHVRRYPGGLDGTARMSLRPAVIRAEARAREVIGSAQRAGRPATSGLTNVKVNTDSDPKVPQNEEAVAVSTDDPKTAVVASNDYVDGGLFIGTTHDGGKTWRSWFQASQLVETRDFCSGGDPSVVYSARDHAFYASQLCFFRAHPESAMEVIRSRDGGDRWTPATRSTEPISNIRSDGSVNASVFYDKEQLAVDNNPSSPHYGRLYITFVKFHFKPSGFGDYCPVQLAYTDKVDPNGDGLLGDTVWTHRSVQPDAPGANGVGTSANQGAQPAPDNVGGLGISFFSEDCNSSLDRAIYFKRLRPDGTFGPLVQIDKPGQWKDNPDLADLLPNKNMRLPASTSAPLVWNQGTLSFEFITQNNINRDGHLTGGRGTGADISYTESSDYGRHWTDMRFVAVSKSGKPAPRDQFLPWLAVDQDGWVNHAIWLDNRNDTKNVRIQTFESEGFTASHAASNTLLSTASWDPNRAFFSSGAFIGDYSGLAEGPATGGGTTTDEYEYPMWTDGRNSPGPPNGDTDVFTVPN